MKKKFNQNLGQTDAHYVYQADFHQEINDVVKVFKDNINKRNDLSQDFKQKALNSPVGRNYEVVYYPAHIYQTDTTKSWNSVNRHTTDDGYVRTTTTTTTRHTKGGYQKTSEAKFKGSCVELEVEKLDLNKTSKVNNFSSIILPVYDKGLFFNREENGKNAIEAGRKASNAKKGDSTHTTWTLHMVLIPIFRYEFEINGKSNCFEMNLHNGTFITDYRQKGGCKFARIMMKLANVALGILMFLLPLLFMINGFKHGFNDNVFLLKALGVVGLGICVIGGLLGGFAAAFATSKSQYEKLFYYPKYWSKIYLQNIIVCAIVIVLAALFKSLAF